MAALAFLGRRARVASVAASAAGVAYQCARMTTGAEADPAVAKKLHLNKACKPIVLCGPSGAGKSTLIQLLKQEFPEDFGFSVSHTSRAPRAGERNGTDYHFAPKEAILAAVAEGKFLEHALVHGNVYGTSFEAVAAVADQCRVCILDIDVQGVKSCKQLEFEAGKYIFIAPPSLELLEARLRARGTETEESIAKRMAGAVRELEAAKHISWDGYIINDELPSSYAALRALTAQDRESCSKARAAGAPAAAAAAAAGGAGSKA